MLAFSFLILVGVVLVVDASHRHIPKGYIYFAMAFSVGVEMLNSKLRKPGKPVKLRRAAHAAAPTVARIEEDRSQGSGVRGQGQGQASGVRRQAILRVRVRLGRFSRHASALDPRRCGPEVEPPNRQREPL